MDLKLTVDTPSSGDITEFLTAASAAETQMPAALLRSHVAVPAQLHADRPSVSHLGKRRDHRREINFALAEHEMLVHTGAHVLDMHVGEPRVPLADLVGDRHFA